MKPIGRVVPTQSTGNRTLSLEGYERSVAADLERKCIVFEPGYGSGRASQFRQPPALVLGAVRVGPGLVDLLLPGNLGACVPAACAGDLVYLEEDIAEAREQALREEVEAWKAERSEAAAIRARADATLGPLEQAHERAAAEARELLGVKAFPAPDGVNGERAQFEAYLAGEDHPAGDMARAAWRRAVEQTPTLRAPEAGVNVDGGYYFDWKFSGLPDLTLTLDFAAPEPGAPVRVGWFFRDKVNDVSEGSEDDLSAVPGVVFTYLRLFARGRP